jgi:hypothetical protein
MAVGERYVRAGTTDVASGEGRPKLPMGERRWHEQRLLERRHVSWEPEAQVRVFLAAQRSERFSARTMRAEGECAG